MLQAIKRLFGLGPTSDALAGALRECAKDPGGSFRPFPGELNRSCSMSQWCLDLARSEMSRRVLADALRSHERSRAQLIKRLESAISEFDHTTVSIFREIYRERFRSNQVMYQIHEYTRDDRVADAVFVHGLDGNALGSWCEDIRLPRQGWPYLLAEDFPNLGVWSYAYPASSTAYQGKASSLESIAGWAVSDLAQHVGDRPLFFIAHSLGGLLVKNILTLKSPEAKRLRERTKGIVFVATPHRGAGLADMARWAKAVYRPTPLMESLTTRSDATLQIGESFARDFENDVRGGRAFIAAFRETEKTNGFLVVSPESADPGISGARVADVPSQNHISIAKCSKASKVYRSTTELLKAAIS